MFGLIKRYREKNKIIHLKEKEQLQQQRLQAEKIVNSAMENMFEKPCPVNKNNKCFEGCVHFKHGHVFYMSIVSIGCGYWTKVFPKCKLWG